jgi:hypothetical protein
MLIYRNIVSSLRCVSYSRGTLGDDLPSLSESWLLRTDLGSIGEIPTESRGLNLSAHANRK